MALHKKRRKVIDHAGKGITCIFGDVKEPSNNYLKEIKYQIKIEMIFNVIFNKVRDHVQYLSQSHVDYRQVEMRPQIS